MGDFALHNRKTSAYFSQNGHHFANNRKSTLILILLGIPEMKTNTIILLISLKIPMLNALDDSIFRNVLLYKEIVYIQRTIK
jgi:hypothetical protein